jgi:hypothetical protein
MDQNTEELNQMLNYNHQSTETQIHQEENQVSR